MRTYRSNQGFTLIEIMLASALLLVVVGMTMNFLFGFNRTGNQMLEQASLEEQLRNSLNRVEKEIIEGALVLPDDGTTNCGGSACATGNNTLVLAVPIYSDDGFLVVDDSGNALTDTLVIRSLTDPRATLLTNRNPDLPPDRLTLTLIPNARSNRDAIADQTIAKDLMPKDTSTPFNYKFPDSFGTAAISTVVTPT
ncbi:MAG: PilW family protein, partial [Candidatus Sericytochromatia bacterium]